MDNVTDHSKAKLALAVFTSPGPAFEEIKRRQLFGTALIIVALTGVVAAASPVVFLAGGERMQWLQLGRTNPIAWVGLWMLYAFAMQKLLKWIGAEVDYVGLLTLMGWSQISLLIAQIGIAGMYYGQVFRHMNLAVQAATAVGLLFSLIYVLLMGHVVRVLSGSPVARGILAYIVVQLTGMIGFAWTYSNARVSPFISGLPAITETLKDISGKDQLPWLGASVVGLVLGVMMIGKHFGWNAKDIKTRAALAGLVGLLCFGVYFYALSKADYYHTLALAQVAYEDQNYAKSAKLLEQFIPQTENSLGLKLEVAELNHLAKADDRALSFYAAAERMLKDLPSGEQKDQILTRVFNGRGAVYDASGNYTKALAEFAKASKAWPASREPWVRSAVTYDRMGKYEEALKAADYGMKKLGSEATVAWVALAEASAQTGKTAQAKAAIAIVTSRDDKLAGRLGKSLDEWKTAVDRLTGADLKFPLEKEQATPPKKPAPKAAKPKK